MTWVKPSLKTFSHLYGNNRLPSDYELLTTALARHPTHGFGVQVPGAAWYQRYTAGSPLSADDWEAFHDPRAHTYASYVKARSAKASVVEGLIHEMFQMDLGRALDTHQLEKLQQVVFPLRHAMHALQMLAGYVGQGAPSGKIAVAAAMQAGDELHRIQALAQWMASIRRAHPGLDFDSRPVFEREPEWQPLRALLERMLVTYDWGEALVALQACLKPLFDDFVMRTLPAHLSEKGAPRLCSIFFALASSCTWHEDWSSALIREAVAQRPDNAEVVRAWIDAWYPCSREALASLSTLARLPPQPPPRAPAWSSLGLSER